MSHTSEKQVLGIEQMLDRIEDVIVNGELPTNLAGDLMSRSLIEFHEKLSTRLASLQEQLKK